MSVLFLGAFPVFALTLYLPFSNKVRYIHAPLQILSTILLIAGMALGIVLGQRIHQLDGYHMIIGFVVVAVLVLFQPAMGLYQHMYYRRTGGRSTFGYAHRWLGRSMMILGIINGGLGFMISGSSDSYTPYGVVAGIIFLIYVAVLIFAWYRSGQETPSIVEKSSPPNGRDYSRDYNRDYEMRGPAQSRHSRIPSDPTPYQEQSTGRRSYTIASRH